MVDVEQRNDDDNGEHELNEDVEALVNEDVEPLVNENVEPLNDADLYAPVASSVTKDVPYGSVSSLSHTEFKDKSSMSPPLLEKTIIHSSTSTDHVEPQLIFFSVFTMKTLASSAPSTSWKTKANKIIAKSFDVVKPEETIQSLLSQFSGNHYIEVGFFLLVVVMDMKVLKDVQKLKQDVEELNITKDVDDGRVAEAKGESKLARDIEELKIKLRKMEVKLNKATVEEGIVVGGGCTLLRLATKVDAIRDTLDTKEQKVGAGIVKRALSYPLKLIVKNSGDNGSVVMGKKNRWFTLTTGYVSKSTHLMPMGRQILGCGRSSRFGRFQGINCVIAGKNLYLMFSCNTGDEMGMHMVSKGVQNVMDFLQNDFPDMEVINISV
ncbi:hypothetical protein IFM89_011487 [Coptis chinensis]|uniref:Uncharacterized protein n=1 Tax=Coptis chinensis TaxID=261450 RepID=A0A835LZ86_9MAGN|nr:hypothetical protein IFM89_011487 [Coptis chinensis]